MTYSLQVMERLWKVSKLWERSWALAALKLKLSPGGKRIERDPNTGDIVISMKTYHQQLMPVVVPRSRRQELSALLPPQEVKKLKGILGSLQWLVAQVRFDLAFHVSSLQGENPPTVGTLLRANKTLTEAKKDADFELRFRSLPLMESGIMMVSDAALGNGMDCAELIRGFLAEARGIDITGKDAYIQITRVPLVGVTDFRRERRVRSYRPRHWIWHAEVADVHSGQPSPAASTTPDYVQEDVYLEHVRRRWNQGAAHLKQTIAKGTWSIEYSPDFVRQVSKKAKKKLEESLKEETAELPGREPTMAGSALLRYVREFGESP